MKMIKIIFILITIFIAIDAEAQTDTYRPVFWLHGLGGNVYSWDKTIEAVEGVSAVPGFPAREIRPLTVTYSENSLNSAGISLFQDINTVSGGLENNNGFSFGDNFIIAHSQGGLTARMLDYLFRPAGIYGHLTKKFGGIVTFGTPHGGAYVLNSVMNGDHEDFITEACEGVIAGPLAEVIENHLILRFLGQLASYQDKQMTLCELIPDVALTTFLESYIQPITSDYAVGASALQTLNSYFHPDILKVAFYSEEDDPVFWRLATHLINKPNTFPPFGANNDQQMVDDAIYNYNYAFNKLEYNKGRKKKCTFFCKKWKRKIAAWEKTVDFWENINEKWEYLIGAKEVQMAYTGECMCIIRTPEGMMDGVTYFESNPDNCIGYESLPDHEECYPIYTTQRVSHGSDGVVIEESAKAFPEAIQVKLIGSNHQQMRNDNNTKIALYDLFEGYHGSYFGTAPK